MCGTNSSQRSLPDSWRKKDSDAEASPPATYAHKFWPWMTLDNRDGDGRGNMQDHAVKLPALAFREHPCFTWKHVRVLYKLPVLRKRFAADHDMHASSISWHYVTSNMQTYPIIPHLHDWSKNWSKKNGLLFQMNMFAVTPRFARGQSRISFDMLKSLRRVLVFYFPQQQTRQTLKPKTLNPKSKP